MNIVRIIVILKFWPNGPDVGLEGRIGLHIILTKRRGAESYSKGGNKSWEVHTGSEMISIYCFPDSVGPLLGKMCQN